MILRIISEINPTYCAVYLHNKNTWILSHKKPPRFLWCKTTGVFPREGSV
jgi:hypothetical protein